MSLFYPVRNMTKVTAANLASDYPVGVGNPDYDPLLGPTGDPYATDRRREARDTEFYNQPALFDGRVAVEDRSHAAPPPLPAELKQLLLDGKYGRFLKEVCRRPREYALAAVTFAETEGDPVLLGALLTLTPVQDQLSVRLQGRVPTAIDRLLVHRELTERDAGDALGQLLLANPGFRSSAEDALRKHWKAAVARLDPDAAARLAEIARCAGLANTLPALDPLAALRNEAASVEQIVRWIDKIDSDATRALRAAVPPGLREAIAQQPVTATMPPAAETVLTLLHDGQYGNAQALLTLLHAAGVPFPTTIFLRAINAARQAGTLDKNHVVPLLSAALGANLSQDINQPLPGADPRRSNGTSVLHLLVEEGALALIGAVLEGGARIDVGVVQQCTSARAVQPLRALYLDAGVERRRIFLEALTATPQAWLGIVDTLLHPADDPDDELLEKRASMLTDFLAARPPGLMTSLAEAGVAGQPRDAALIRFAVRFTPHHPDAGHLLLLHLCLDYGIAAGGKAGALALAEALREGAWPEVAFYGRVNTNANGARQLAACAIARGAAEPDVAALLGNARRKHRDRHPLVRLFLFLRHFGRNAWARQPVEVAGRRSTIVELLKERQMDLARLLRLPQAQ